MVRVLGALLSPDEVRRIAGSGDRGRAGGDGGVAGGAAGGEEVAGGGPDDAGEIGAVGSGGLRRSRRRRAVAPEVELEEVEEGAGDEGAEDEAAATLDDALERYDEPHARAAPSTAEAGCGRPGLGRCSCGCGGVGGFLGGGWAHRREEEGRDYFIPSWFALYL